MKKWVTVGMANTEQDVPNSDYSISNDDVTNTYHSVNSNYNLLTKVTKFTTLDATNYSGYICNFDVTGNILNSTNTLKIYIYLANTGTGAKFLFCSNNLDVTKTTSNFCQFPSSYDSTTNEITGINASAAAGLYLNVIEIKRGSSNSVVTISVNGQTAVIKTFLF